MKAVLKYLKLILARAASEPSNAKAILRSNTESYPLHLQIQILGAVLPFLLKDGIRKSTLTRDLKIEGRKNEIRRLFSSLLQHTIQLSRKLKNDDFGSLRSEQSTFNNFDMLPALNISTEVLNGVLNLLPFNDFLESAVSLLDMSESTGNLQQNIAVQAFPSFDTTKSVLKCLELRMRSAGRHNFPSNKSAGLNLTPRLLSILSDTESEDLKVSAIACLDLVCERFGRGDRKKVYDAVKTIIENRCVTGDNETLKAMSLHCIASSVELLGNEFIPLIQPVLHAIIDCLDKSIEPEMKSIKSQNAAFACVTVMIDQLSFALPQRPLETLTSLCSKAAVSRNEKSARSSRSDFLKAFSTRLDVRIVFSTLTQEWQAAVRHGPRVSNLKVCTPAIETLC